MHIFRQFATNVSLYPLLWDDEINNGLSLSNVISLCSHENNDIAAAVIQTLYELVDQVNFGFDFPCPSSLSVQPGQSSQDSPGECSAWFEITRSVAGIFG